MTLVTRDPATGLRHSGIRHPNHQPPTPYGCRWCGDPKDSHGRSWVGSVGMHTWHQPTTIQILSRMHARRAARLLAPAPKYHAVTDWTGTQGNPEDPGEERCADCRSTNCPKYWRIQRRRSYNARRFAFDDLPF